jgi:hypothetical protein
MTGIYLTYDNLWYISNIYQVYTCHMTPIFICLVYVWYMSGICQDPKFDIYQLYT